ncbi:MAG: hypothetical protein KKE79_00275 [Actinobacteria bacterium]|nr:hypothetical protein [Actinomycetota bacterium]MBU4489053.1 hypothetical protein [Actinomycetota bacterium]
MKANVIVFEATILVFSLAFYFGARRAMGKSRNRAFLLGAILFSLAMETGAVLGGVKNFYWYSINGYYNHYPLGGYVIWLGIVPLAATLLWYIVAASSYLTATTLMPNGKWYSRSAVAGAIAVGFYMLIEPIAVTNHWWTWNVKSFYVIDVPLLALFAVFLSVFVFLANYYLTVADTRDIKALKALEKLTIRRWSIDSQKSARSLKWNQLQMLFWFRLVPCLVVFAVAIAPVMFLLWLVANRGHIPPGW